MSRDSITLLLAVDTSTRFAGVGIDDGNGSVVCRSWRSEQNHGAELMPAIMAMLEESGRTPADITHLAVANGPGGFSALRVGIGVVFGLATPRDLPIAAISTHEIEVAPYVDRVGRSTALYSLLPAGRGEVAWAKYVDGREVTAGLAPPEKLAADVSPDSVFCGEAAMMMANVVEYSRLLTSGPPTRDPAALLALGRKYFARNNSGVQQPVRPQYVREPSITWPKPPK